jgi:hypothetical protein
MMKNAYLSANTRLFLLSIFNLNRLRVFVLNQWALQISISRFFSRGRILFTDERGDLFLGGQTHSIGHNNRKTHEGGDKVYLRKGAAPTLNIRV